MFLCNLLAQLRMSLETSLGALVVARAGRQDCPELDAMLQEWDGALTVLVRKRVNRHVERCGRAGGGAARIAGHAPRDGADRRAAADGGGSTACFRDRRWARHGNFPAAVAHRAAMAKTSYSFGHHGFPRPLHQPGSPWLHAGPARRSGGRHRRRGRGGRHLDRRVAAPRRAAAGTPTPGVTGSADPGLGHDGQPGTPRASATAQAGVQATAGVVPVRDVRPPG